MKDILAKILQKRGLSSVEELDKEEKQTFDQWQATLSKDELTIQDVKDFCQNQVDIIEGKWTDLNIRQEQKGELIPYHTVYNLLLRVLDSPKDAREALEKNLQQLLWTQKFTE